MNAQELYENLKRAAEYFDLGFRDMDRILVLVEEGSIVLSYASQKIILQVEQDTKILPQVPGLG